MHETLQYAAWAALEHVLTLYDVGATGMDIASEASQCGAAAVFLSCRRPVHVVPRYIFCAPSDAILPPWLGVTVSRRLLEFGVTCLIRLSRGSQSSFNFPPPKFGLLRVCPVPYDSPHSPISARRKAMLFINLHACLLALIIRAQMASLPGLHMHQRTWDNSGLSTAA